MSLRTVPARRAAGVLVATAAVALAAAPPAAGAAGSRSVTTTTSYAGSTAADGVSIALDLPQAVGPVPAHVVLGLLSAHGRLGHDGIHRTSPDVAEAVAALASGTLVDDGAPLAQLGHAATADRAHPDASTTVGAMPANPLVQGSLLPLTARVRGLATSASNAELVRGKVATLADLLPAEVRQQIDAALGQVVPAAQQAIDQALAALAPVLGPVVGQDPTGKAAQLQQELQQLKDRLPALVSGIEDAAVLSIDGLHATQSVHRTARAVTSTAAVRLAGLDLLGGLVHLSGFASSATATASGLAGGAAAEASSDAASVRVGDGLLGIALTDRGKLVADVGGLLPDEVVEQVDAALAQVTAALNQILDQAGVSITPAAVSHHARPDGRSADAAGSGLLVTLQPPGQARPLLQVGIGAVQAKATGAVVKVLDERAQLPNTGSGLGTGTLVGASAALVGGLWIRRRLGRTG